MEMYYVPPSAWLTLGVLLSSGLIFALLTLYFQVLDSYPPSQIIFSWLLLQKSLTILGSSFYGGAILLGTTDYFLQDSLLLDWVWERVKVDRIIDNNIDIMVTTSILVQVRTNPRCHRTQSPSVGWPG